MLCLGPACPRYAPSISSYLVPADNSGYGRGEGVAALILEPLDAAIKAGSRVHAVIMDSGLKKLRQLPLLLQTPRSSLFEKFENAMPVRATI